jgi:hypothetical protein
MTFLLFDTYLISLRYYINAVLGYFKKLGTKVFIFIMGYRIYSWIDRKEVFLLWSGAT